jgi:hypothetical protein
VNDDKLDMYNEVRKENGLSPAKEVESFPTIITEEATASPNQTNVSPVSQEELIETVNSSVTGDPSSPTPSATSTNTASGSPMSMLPGSPVANMPANNPEAIAEESESLSVSPIAPPSLNADMIVTNNNRPKSPNQTTMGGGLYPAIASTAYHLAPAAVLLATAAATFKCQKGKGKRGTRRGRRRGRR